MRINIHQDVAKITNFDKQREQWSKSAQCVSIEKYNIQSAVRRSLNNQIVKTGQLKIKLLLKAAVRRCFIIL